MALQGVLGSLIVDVLCLVTCAALLLRYGRLGHSHPAVIYLIFHAYAFTFRLFSLVGGSKTLFSTFQGNFEPVTMAEIMRAAGMADAALVVFTLACITAYSTGSRRNPRYGQPGGSGRTDMITLSPLHVWRIVLFALPIGVFGLLFLTNLPGMQQSANGDSLLNQSSYFAITPSWTGLCLLSLIYLNGFKKYFAIPLVLYLLLMILQGYHRFRVIIPTILALQIYMDRHQMRWPTYRMISIYALLVLAFFPMKSIGRMIQRGESLQEIIINSNESISEALSGEHGDTQFMDQFASALTLVDDHGKFFHGSVYLALITLPIPRQLWPDKPGLADYLKEISTPTRPMGEFGMIVTYLGELYVNFGSLGVYFVTFLLGYLLSKLYFAAYMQNYYSVIRFVYLLVSCNLIVVYRDGLISFVIFTFVNMMPLVLIALLHYFAPFEVRVSPACEAVGSTGR